MHIEKTGIPSNKDAHTSKKKTYTSKTDTCTNQMKDLRKSKRSGSISARHTHTHTHTHTYTHTDIERRALANKVTGISVKKRAR